MSNLQLFQGYDTFSGSPKNTVVQGLAAQPSSDARVSVSVCTSLEQVNSSIEIDASVAVSYGVFKADAKSKYLHSLSLSTYSVTVVLYASRTKTTTRDTVAIPDALKKSLKGPAQVMDFVGGSGDCWVSELTSGSEYIGTFTFRSADLDEQTRVEAALSASGVVAGVSVDASLSMKLANAVKTANVAYDINHFMSGTTKAPTLPGHTVKDVDAMIQYALSFITVEADQPATVGFKVEPYESLLGSDVDFSAVRHNRNAFKGNPVQLGWGGMATQLQAVVNAGRDVNRLMSFYGVEPDAQFKSRLAQVTADLSALYDHLQDVAEQPTVAVSFAAPASLGYGTPSPLYTVRVPVDKNFLNGGGGGTYQDVNVGQVAQYVRLDGITVWCGSWIDMVTLSYSTLYPPQSFSATHGSPGGGQQLPWTLQPGEFVTSMHGFKASHVGIYDVGGLHFKTNLGNDWYTRDTTDDSYTEHWDCPPGQVLIGFAGSSGSSVDCMQPVVVQFMPVAWKAIDNR